MRMPLLQLRRYEDGYCRAVGVSNYEVRHLEELVQQQKQQQEQADAVRVLPHVNQVELQPLNWNSKRGPFLCILQRHTVFKL